MNPFLQDKDTPDRNMTDNMEDRVFEFLEMSRRLLSLIEHENKILETCGALSIESYLLHRDELLKDYESKAAGLIERLQADNGNNGADQLMIEEITTLKQALNDNTRYKFQSLEKELTGYTGDASWH